jgi:hypothetical protein
MDDKQPSNQGQDSREKSAALNKLQKELDEIEKRAQKELSQRQSDQSSDLPKSSNSGNLGKKQSDLPSQNKFAIPKGQTPTENVKPTEQVPEKDLSSVFPNQERREQEQMEKSPNEINLVNPPSEPASPPATRDVEPDIQDKKDLGKKGDGKQNPAIWIALIILVALFTGFGGYFLGQRRVVEEETPSATLAPVSTFTPTPSPDPTANWKTYMSDNFAYSLKYPTGEGYIQETCGEDFNNAFLLHIEGDSGYDNPQLLCIARDAFYSFELYPSIGKFSQSDYPKESDVASVTSEIIEVAGVLGKKFTITKIKSAPIPDKRYEVFLENGGYKYRIIFTAFAHEQLFDQILSTLLFLENAPTPSLSPSPSATPTSTPVY